MVIKINVADKIAELTDKDAYIVCDNSDYVVQFTFDSAWDDYEMKTARFSCGCGYIDVPFLGNECEVPILQHGKAVSIGVFAGSLVTTTAATVPLLKSIRSRGGEPLPPESAVYDRIMALIKQGGVEVETLYQIIARYLAENPYTETDPTVPSWAKADTKPTYTASEVGADTSGTAANAVAAHDAAKNAHSDIRSLIESVTTSKVNVSDIIDDLTTNVSDKPLSAAQGVALKALIDEISTDYRLISDSYSKSETDTLLASAGKVKTVNNIEPDANGNITIEGGTGQDGTTFTPIVSADGTLSWTNDGGKDNPTPVNIKGAKGDSGATGAQGEKGDKGDTGATGATGAAGAKGADGTSVTVASVSESTADGGSNVVTFSDGKTVTIKNGSKGSQGEKGDTGATGAQGEKGDDGYTPVKGTDYWTAADKSEMVDDVLAALPTWTGGSY